MIDKEYEEAANDIHEALDEHGLAVLPVTNGIIIAMTAEKLQEFMNEAKISHDNRVIIFVKDEGPENIDDSGLKN